MGTTTQLQGGMWLVNFPEFKLDSGKNTWFPIWFNQIGYTVEFSVNETVAAMQLTERKFIFSYYYIFKTNY